jgi:hypothetical protein
MLSKVTLTTQLKGLAVFQYFLNRKKTNKLSYLNALLAIALLLFSMTALAGSVAAGPVPPTASGAVAPGSQLTGPGAGYAFTFPQEFRAELSASQQAYSGYVTVKDDSEAITVDVPTAWNDVETGRWMYRGRDVGVFIAASADLQAFNSRKPEPGVFIGVSHTLAHEGNDQGILNFEQNGHAQGCKRQGRSNYKDPFYAGQSDLYVQCAAGGRNRMVVVALPANREWLILLRITAKSDADLQAATKIFQTFQVLGDPEHDEHHDH